MVELASQPGACVAQIARENGVNDNVIFKWLRLWQNEGRVSRRLPVTTSSDTGVELLPVEITPDEQKEPVAAIAPSLSTSTQTRVSASSCKVEFRHGNMMNRPGFPGEYFICELRLPDHRFRWKHNKLFLLLPEEYGPAFPAIVDCYTSPPT
ncbi:transposase [Escherichia coli]|nr:transposase [Escherichia coli]UNF10081.1 transposase [Escherichia coli]